VDEPKIHPKVFIRETVSLDVKGNRWWRATDYECAHVWILHIDPIDPATDVPSWDHPGWTYSGNYGT